MKIEMYTGYIRNWETLCNDLNIRIRGNRDWIEREILLHGMEKWGISICERLCGAFSFVIRDEVTNTVYSARDHFGLRRFYYYMSASGAILFGSNIQEITREPSFEKRMDLEALRIFIRFGYVAGERTMYQNLHKLMPGHYMIYQNGQLKIHRYFTPSFVPDFMPSEAEWIQKIEDTMLTILAEDRTHPAYRNAISLLSGGVDSSFLLALNGVEKAYGIGFHDTLADEMNEAEAAARAMGRSFQIKQISAQEYFDFIPRAIRAMEMPLADASAVAFSIGCREIAQSAGLLFSGEGADELFAGYWVYQRAEALAKTVGDSYRGCMGIMDERLSQKLLKDQSEAIDDYSMFGDTLPKPTGAAEYLSQLLETDIRLFLEGDILFNVGCVAADIGIEILTPFLDPRLFAVASRIPAEYKLRDGCGKYIFRKTAEKHIPFEAAWWKKNGFSVPIRKWFADDVQRGRIESRLFGRTSRTYFNQKLLRSFWEDYLAGNQAIWNILYAVYVYVIWYETCFEANDA